MTGAITVTAKYQHDNIDRYAVGTVKFDRLIKRGKKRACRCGAGNCCMWQCDAIADCRAAEFLAVNDRIEDSPLTQTGVTSHASAQAFKKLFLACHGMPAQQDARHQVRFDHEMALKKS
jgi:hypothetical protein